MNLIVLATALIVSLIVFWATRGANDKFAQAEADFWEKERAANSVRRKSLDDLDYLTIPMDKLPVNLYTDNDTIASCIDTIGELSKSPVVNLTGISNTDLKMKYGAPNINILSAADANYTRLVQAISYLAADYIDHQHITEARQLLEYGVSIGTDSKRTYLMLASIYKEEGHSEKIQDLIESANKIESLLRESIITSLTKMSSEE